MPKPKGTILIVDDEKSVLDLISLLLRAEEYDTLVADSGYQAFSLLEQRLTTFGNVNVDLIITDWVMKGWDGIKLLSEILQKPYQTVPVILMSGAVSREELVNAARKGAKSILLKPIVKEDLLAKVETILGKRSRA